MRNSIFVTCLAAGLFAFVFPAAGFPQGTKLGEHCDLAGLGEKDAGKFIVFDRRDGCPRGWEWPTAYPFGLTERNTHFQFRDVGKF